MSRLVDADALIEPMENACMGVMSGCSPFNEPVKVLKSAPTVDAVEVIRCRDCKYWEYDAIFSDGWCRGKHQGNPDWFCADGERREE